MFFSQSGDDQLYGNLGNDGLTGGQWKNIYYGVEGDDRFYWETGDDLEYGAQDNNKVHIIPVDFDIGRSDNFNSNQSMKA